MNFSTYSFRWVLSFIICIACNEGSTKQASDNPVYTKGSYGYAVQFLKTHTKQVIELQDKNGQGKILLSADYQGRVMTSTATGDSGTSYGWLNYDLIASGKKKPQFNPVGGEERFWMGPEGGQYSIYFKKDDSFSIAHWQVPGIIDTVMFDAVQPDESKAIFTKKASISNYSGTVFNIFIQRTIVLLDKQAIAQKLLVSIPDNIYSVGYETYNEIRNTGADWKKQNGLLSIWLLGMFAPSEETTVIIPFRPFANARQYITDDYFGTIPASRLQIKDSVLFFTCDGNKRSKIGLPPVIAKPIAASYDFKNNVLTLIKFSIDPNGSYVNSKWEIQKQPYAGDVVNSYNDGPLEDGSQLGPFYELESSSPALELKKGETQLYRQITCHFEGDYDSLLWLAKQLLGIDLDDLKK